MNRSGNFPSRSKLHFNKSGTSLLIKNVSKVVNLVWLINQNDNGEVRNLTKNCTASVSKVSHLGNLR